MGRRSHHFRKRLSTHTPLSQDLHILVMEAAEVKSRDERTDALRPTHHRRIFAYQ